MSTILIQTRVDEYTTPELYAELEAIPAGNARTTRLKNLANEALILKRQLGLSASPHPVDSQGVSAAQGFTNEATGKSAHTPRTRAQSSGAGRVGRVARDRDSAPEPAPTARPASEAADQVRSDEANAQAQPAGKSERPAASGSRAASRVLSMSTLRGG
jgi:hypothetical protein